MPLPLFLGIGAAIAGVTGVGTAVHGGVKMKDANDTMKAAQSRQQANIARFEKWNKLTNESMDKLGALELEILHSFSAFSEIIEKIQNRPEFAAYSKDGVELPEYDGETLRQVSVGAGVLLGGLGGAALGTAGGFAAAGATTAAVMALGTASTGTAIASLSGAAATNATLAALGGGALAAGGGGMALGSTILGATTLGVGLLIGGIIFNVSGHALSSKADEAWAQMKDNEATIDRLCMYLSDLKQAADGYYTSMEQVNTVYRRHLAGLDAIVNLLGKTDWNQFTDQEKQLTENTVLLVALLYKMCKVELVLKSDTPDGINRINRTALAESTKDAQTLMMDDRFVA